MGIIPLNLFCLDSSWLIKSRLERGCSLVIQCFLWTLLAVCSCAIIVPVGCGPSASLVLDSVSGTRSVSDRVFGAGLMLGCFGLEVSTRGSVVGLPVTLGAGLGLDWCPLNPLVAASPLVKNLSDQLQDHGAEVIGDWRVKSGITHLVSGPSGGCYLSVKQPPLGGLVDSAHELDSAKLLGCVLSPSVIPLVDPGPEVTGRSSVELPIWPQIHLAAAISQ